LTEDPIVSEISDPTFYRTVVARTTKEIGAGQMFHADCPCCGYRFRVEHSDAEKLLYDRNEQTLKRKTRDKIQAYFTDVWKWKTHEREMYLPDNKTYGPNKSKGIRSDSIDMVYMAGAGYGLHRAWKRAERYGYRNWFAIGWLDRPTIGEMFMCIPLGNFFNVVQGVADDSPEFANRTRMSIDNAVKRDGASLAEGVDDEPAGQRDEGRVEFDPLSAVHV